MIALSGPSDLQTDVLQLKRGGREKRGKRIRRLVGRPSRGRIARREGNQIVRQHLGRPGGFVVSPVLLKRDALVRRRLLATTRSAATNTAVHSTAATMLGRGLRKMRGTASRREGRSAQTRLAATQPDRNQAGDE